MCKEISVTAKLLRSIIAIAVVLCLFVACRGGETRKHVMVMWCTDHTDPAYQQWNEQLADEFERQGVNAEIHPYYGEIGISREGLEEEKIIRMIHRLDSLGKRPDIILAHGDYCLWQVELNPDSLVSSIPCVGFGLKDYDWMERMWDYLKGRGYNRNNIVEIHDSLRLKENLDLADFIFNLKAEGDTSKVCLHAFVSMIDRQAVWVDSLIYKAFCNQIAELDTAEYYPSINPPFNNDEYNRMNSLGIKRFYAYSIKTPLINPTVRGATSTWAFYSQKSRLRYIQTKHDESSRSCTEGPNFPPYCTMTAEDFLVNDSCYGGYFVTTDSLFHDAVAASKRIWAGEPARSIGRSYHTPTWNVNWNVMRLKGFKIQQMPEYIHLYNTTFHDNHPLFAELLYIIGGTFAILFIAASVVYSFVSLRRQRHTRRLIKKQARESIRDKELLELALNTSEATMWDGSESTRLRYRITADEEYREQLEAFYNNIGEGQSSTQFHGSIDGHAPHWYDLRIETHQTSDGHISKNGLLINIDHSKLVQEKAREAHQLLLKAQAREGFISTMNHEIRTPLHAVVGFALELARPGIKFGKEEVAEFAGFIESNAASLKKIINDILLVTLMSHSNVTATMKQCSVESLLNPKQWREAMALTVRRRNTVDIMPGGGDVMVNADPKMMVTVLENLITNASMFSDEGSRISIGWNRTKGGGAEIWVRDEGIGIEPKYHELIFERFFKINSFNPGGGLGLYITKKYMEKMNGKIEVESTLSAGSVFRLKVNG